MKFRNLLLPLDLSEERGSEIVGAALELVDARESEVVLLHVIEPIEGIADDELSDFYDDLERRAHDFLAHMAEQLAGRAHALRSEVRFGTRAAEILRFAETGVDLIVMHSRSLDPNDPHAGVGTVSQRVALLAQCPVLLLRG